MLKVGPYVLAALVLFALVFAFLPTKSAAAQTGATLSDVALTLYPASDPDAHWTFEADEVVNDPLAGTTHLSALKDGGRWVQPRAADGRPAGQPVLDATIAARDLTIDSQDNITTQAATITLVQQCADIRLSGNSTQPVRVEQSRGFSAPKAEVDSPSLVGEVLDLRMTFGFVVEESSEESSLGWNMNATEECVDGQRRPTTPAGL